MTRTLDTSTLGPICIDARSPRLVIIESPYAGAVAAQRPAWANAADSIGAGKYANAWTVAAMVAIEDALRRPMDDPE